MVAQLDLLDDLRIIEPETIEIPRKKRAGRQKPKSNKKGDTNKSETYDRCQTPPWAVAPLLPYLVGTDLIWESACGEGMLADALAAAGFTVLREDILTGHNFFARQSPPPGRAKQVTNPPYSVKYDWLEHSFELGIPFAILVPGEMILASTTMALYAKYGQYGKPEFLALDQRISFKMPNKGWEWVDEEGKKKKSSAQFPVVWLCHNLLPDAYLVGHVPRPHERNQLTLDLS